MKPNADMITKILHNFRVNGKFDHDQLIIGRGVDEQLQLMITDTIGIRYVPNGESNPNIEYTNDGITWNPFRGTDSAGITYEPIEFNASHLSSDGKITIQHNFNDKNVLCLGYTPQPKEIEYLDNQLVLDYSDQNGSNLTGAVWFVNSVQSMLVVPSSVEFLDEQYEGNLIANITLGTEANKIESGDLIMTKDSDGSWTYNDNFNHGGWWCLCGQDCCGAFGCAKRDNVWQISCGCDDGYVGKTLPLNTNLVGYSADSQLGTNILSLVIKKQINDVVQEYPPSQIYVDTSGHPYAMDEYNEANGWYVLDAAIKDDITINPDNLTDCRNRTWRRTTDTGYEFVIQYMSTETSWHIDCVKHPSGTDAYDCLYISKSPENATSPWLITMWEDYDMIGMWENIVTLDEPTTN